MTPSEIKSRPVYSTLKPDTAGIHHVLVADSPGSKVLRRLLQELPAERNLTLLYVLNASLHGATAIQSPCSSDIVIGYTDRQSLLNGLHAQLRTCRMGTRLYIAGTEGFIGACVRMADCFGMKADEFQREHCGSLARPVMCVHCHTMQDDVTASIVQCIGCGRMLLVRDHFSRRRGAFMGVQVDAETPGVLPEVVEAFP